MKTGKTITLQRQHHKEGVALVITLGFLAILTIIAVSFAMQMRMERLAQRGVLSTAQTRHLLDTALSRAMADINSEMGDDWYPPPYISSGASLGSTSVRSYSHSDGTRLSDTMDLTQLGRNDPGNPDSEYLGFSDLEFIPTGWIWGSSTKNLSDIYYDYRDAFDEAEWQDVLDRDDKIIGRVGYYVVNMSGLLDANHVGGYTNSGAKAGYMPRKNGRTPAEIQLSKNILTEFPTANDGTYPGLNASGAGYTVGHPLKATPPDLSAGLAMAYCRTNAWRRFETVRDFYRCNQLGHYQGVNSAGESKPIDSNILRNRPKNFFTFSYFPPDDREYMGRTLTEIKSNDAIIRNALPDSVDADFVMNQLRDYLDNDTSPEDENGVYTDFSVEPVPLINELGFSCKFDIEKRILEADDLNGIFQDNLAGDEVYVLENKYKFSFEVWYPFAVFKNKNSYTLNFEGGPVLPAGTEDLFGDPSLPNSIDLGGSADQPWRRRDPQVFSTNYTSDRVVYNSSGELTDAISLLDKESLEFDEITVRGEGIVDRVQDVKIALTSGDLAALQSDIEALGNRESTDYELEFGLAVVDPRLNWDASDVEQWITVGDARTETPPLGLTLGELNDNITDIGTPDKKDVLYVRNENRIDSPYEFTYFLYDKEQPWQTFQFFRDNDPDGTRFIVDYLHTYPDGPPRQGLVNPNTDNPNVMASVFYRMPVNTFAQNLDDYTGQRLNVNASDTVGDSIINITGGGSRPITKHSDLGNHRNLSSQALLANAIQPESFSMDDINPWKAESILRNSAELFNPRNNTFAVFVVAQQVIDADEDGTITAEEVQLTQRAIAYVWRDPGPDSDHESSCVFYQRSESLGVFGKGENKGAILDAFRPTPTP